MKTLTSIILTAICTFFVTIAGYHYQQKVPGLEFSATDNLSFDGGTKQYSLSSFRLVNTGSAPAVEISIAISSDVPISDVATGSPSSLVKIGKQSSSPLIWQYSIDRLLPGEEVTWVAEISQADGNCTFEARHKTGVATPSDGDDTSSSEVFTIFLVAMLALGLAVLMVYLFRRQRAEGRSLVSSVLGIFAAESTPEDQRAQTLRLVLINNEWFLTHSPESGQGKNIEFLSDGMIGQGRNHNEHSWLVENGKLVIKNPAGEVFSRFAYDVAASTFTCTDEPDLKCKKGQSIKPR